MLSRSTSALTVVAITVGTMLASNATAGTSCGISYGPRVSHSHYHSSHSTHSTHDVKLGITGVFAHCGVRVQSVECGSIAEQLGLECGDVVLSINGQSIHCREDLRRGLRDAVHCGRISLRVDDARHGHVVNLAGRFIDRDRPLDFSAPIAAVAESF